MTLLTAVWSICFLTNIDKRLVFVEWWYFNISQVVLTRQALITSSDGLRFRTRQLVYRSRSSRQLSCDFVAQYGSNFISEEFCWKNFQQQTLLCCQVSSRWKNWISTWMKHPIALISKLFRSPLPMILQWKSLLRLKQSRFEVICVQRLLFFESCWLKFAVGTLLDEW